VPGAQDTARHQRTTTKISGGVKRQNHVTDSDVGYGFGLGQGYLDALKTLQA
jgi:hypothetical protein